MRWLHRGFYFGDIYEQTGNHAADCGCNSTGTMGPDKAEEREGEAMREMISLPSDLDGNKCELWRDPTPYDDCQYTMNYRMRVGWTHSRCREYDYAIHWLRYMSAFDAWQIANGYSGYDGDAEFRKVWAT